jgi:osmotically-inducible protein OsmY
VSRSFPILATALLVTGVAVGAEAHALTVPATSSTIISRSSVAAFKDPAPGQSDDVAAKVKAALKANPDLSGPSEALTVTSAAGVVTLEGTVSTPQVRAKIGEAALKVEGVDKLVNKIKLPKN